MSDCIGCKYCLYDNMQCEECLCENITEDELEKHWTDAINGCPHFEECEMEIY